MVQSTGGSEDDDMSARGKGRESVMDLTIDTYSVGDCTVVDVQGEVDVYTAPRLRERLAELASTGQHSLIIDLEQVGFLDSTGLGVLVGALKRVRAEDGFVRLVCKQERLRRMLRITGLSKVFSVFSNVESAALGGPGDFPSQAAG
jgi:anti-sigma B factor antagonist